MLITNANIITWGDSNQILTDHAIYIDEGVIQALAPTRQLLETYPYAERIDARGQWVMPGNICAHTHFYGAYARGMAIPGDAPKNFPEVLERLWWPLDKALDKDTVRMSALVSLVDAIKHGTTTLIDHHASPNFIDGSLDVIADAVTQAGLRAVLCYEVTDRDGREKAEAGIAENRRAMQTYTEAHPLVRATFGLHASLTLTDETLRASADANTVGGFHIHVAEHEADEEDSLRQYGKRVIQRLQDFGIINPLTILAHCVHIDDAERAILREAGTWVSHQPRSNMNNAVGAMAFDTMMREGLKVCLGNDGFSNNMWAEWKEAYLLHKVTHRDPRLANGADVAKMATYHNAKLGQMFFDQSLGKIGVDAAADLIFVDYHPFTPLTVGNLPWHILFGFESSMVTTTIVNGKILMRDRQLLTLNEADIAAEALSYAPLVWERYNKQVQKVLNHL
jgi:putative selenium metabolism protein SsnA